MSSILAFFNKVWTFFTGIPQWCIDVLKALISAAWIFFKDVFFFIVETFLGLASAALGALGSMFTSLPSLATYIADVPVDMLNMIGLIRLPEALAIIISALGIRILLQVIPFTRLGS